MTFYLGDDTESKILDKAVLFEDTLVPPNVSQKFGDD